MTRKQMVRIGVYGTLGVGMLLFLLHPYSRQTVFGPQLQDMPLCYWQDNYRSRTDRDANGDSLLTKVCQWLGLAKHQRMVGMPEGDDGLRLLLSLADDPQPSVREAVAHDLGRRDFASKERVPALRRLLDDPESKVRAAAAWSLGRIQPEGIAALPRLLELAGDAGECCRVQAAEAVWRMDPNKRREVVLILQQALKHGDPKIRASALDVLQELGTDAAEAFAEIAACATTDPQMRVRATALQTLGAFGKPAIPIPVKGPGDPSAYSRASAAHALSKVGPDAKESVPALRALSSDSSVDVREGVKRALQRIDPEQFPAQYAEPE